LWQRVLIASLLGVLIQISITTEQASPEVIQYKDRPLLMQVDPKEVARELLNPKQYSCLTKLVGKESAWKSEAQNPVSTASGIGQLLDGTYKNLGMEKSDSGVAQLVATLSYIHRRHVTPCGAWKHFEKKGWY
jgi:hypothetical protein